MKLLFLTPQLPFPPKQGTALRNWGLISHLAKRHDIWLLSFDDTGVIEPTLRDTCVRVATFPTPKRTSKDRLKTLLTSAMPDMGWRLWHDAFLAQFNEWVAQENFDIIQIEGIELARYGLQPAIRNSSARLVFDDHNCEYLMQRRWFERDVQKPKRWHAAAYSFVQWRRLMGLERAMIGAAHATLCVSPQDRLSIQKLDPRFDPHVILNGIDVESYAPINQPTANSQLLFTGKMDFRPNIDAALWFGERVFPLVQVAHPQAQFVVVGQQPSARLDVLRANPNILITGGVEDIRPHIQQASVYVAPLHIGSGTRFKLLEAMAMRKPIVSTTLGCEGFEVTHGREMMIADDPSRFAQAVSTLLGDEAQRTAMGKAAHTFVSATYDWRAIVPKLESVYARVRLV